MSEEGIPYYETRILCGSEFADERGIIKNILFDDRINHVAVITSKAGTVRGNHYHPRDVQYIYVLSGRLTARSRPIFGNAPVRELTAEAGDLLTCGPMIGHAYEFLEDTVMLNIDCDPRDKERYGEHTVPWLVTDDVSRP